LELLIHCFSQSSCSSNPYFTENSDKKSQQKVCYTASVSSENLIILDFSAHFFFSIMASTAASDSGTTQSISILVYWQVYCGFSHTL